MKKLLVSLSVLALCAFGLVTATSAAASNYHCKRGRCWTIGKPTAKFYVGYSDGAVNHNAGTFPLTCETDHQITKKYSFSASASASSDAIFASISATVKGGLEKSASTGLKVQVGPIKVPNHSSVRCQRGVVVYKFPVHYCKNDPRPNCSNVTVSAPQGPSWRVTKTKVK